MLIVSIRLKVKNQKNDLVFRFTPGSGEHRNLIAADCSPEQQKFMMHALEHALENKPSSTLIETELRMNDDDGQPWRIVRNQTTTQFFKSNATTTVDEFMKTLSETFGETGEKLALLEKHFYSQQPSTKKLVVREGSANRLSPLEEKFLEITAQTQTILGKEWSPSLQSKLLDRFSEVEETFHAHRYLSKSTHTHGAIPTNPHLDIRNAVEDAVRELDFIAGIEKSSQYLGELANTHTQVLQDKAAITAALTKTSKVPVDAKGNVGELKQQFDLLARIKSFGKLCQIINELNHRPEISANLPLTRAINQISTKLSKELLSLQETWEKKSKALGFPEELSLDQLTDVLSDQAYRAYLTQRLEYCDKLLADSAQEVEILSGSIQKWRAANDSQKQGLSMEIPFLLSEARSILRYRHQKIAKVAKKVCDLSQFFARVELQKMHDQQLSALQDKWQKLQSELEFSLPALHAPETAEQLEIVRNYIHFVRLHAAEIQMLLAEPIIDVGIRSLLNVATIDLNGETATDTTAIFNKLKSRMSATCSMIVFSSSSALKLLLTSHNAGRCSVNVVAQTIQEPVARAEKPFSRREKIQETLDVLNFRKRSQEKSEP